MEKWIVTAVDYGDNCDGKARVSAICSSEEGALEYIRNDIEEWADRYAGENIEVDFERMSARFRDSDRGCEWNFHLV